VTKTRTVPIRFFVITFAWAWIPWLACALWSLRSTKGKGAVRTYLKSFMTPSFGWKTWVAIFITLGSSTAVAWILPRLFGEAGVSTLLPSVFIFPLYGLTGSRAWPSPRRTMATPC
jgi:uncharacterized protein